MSLPRISVFPKCYFDEIVSGARSYVSWIHDAGTLGGEGVEHYDEFFPSYDERDVAPVMAAMSATGQISSMLCFSPDFTHPDPDERTRQVERQKRAIDLAVRVGAHHCRTLSGQKYPGLSLREGVARAADCIRRSLDYAAARNVVLCLENHYKVSEWVYPEFAQQEEPFLALLDALPETPYLGVQFDPSNALIGGFDPVSFLDKVKHRVVTMHASDRYLEPGTTLDDVRAHDGTVGYPDKMKHGETGKGMNDYDAIFAILRSVNFTGWISVEDGMNGLDELRRSVEFLKRKRSQYYPPD
ncbi:MAG TPA: sugar phosphate isomerase/epimerase family protein [Vicinamibacterales bacterium]|nr:sugar phosphate isomerase/epimerase family protein [Vicinamibacterales bacterium]